MQAMDETSRTLTAREFQEASGAGHWRVLGTGASAWFGAASHAEGAALVGALLDALVDALAATPEGTPDPPPVDLDVRADGVRVRIPLTPEDGGFGERHVVAAHAVSAAATALGLHADPGAVQDVQLALDVLDQAAVQPFWARVLGYDAVGEEDLMDPLRRHPPVWFQDQDAPRPLRNRLHVDIVTPREQARSAVDAAPGLGATSVTNHGYYATVADAEGNEVDLLPLAEGADRWPDPGTEDWRLVFAAAASYRVPSAREAARLTAAVAALADEAALPLGIDVRPGLVTVHSGKDRWETDAGYDVLAARVQQAARGLGLVADVALPRFVQVVVDAVDIPAVRAFWRTVLGYAEDPRPQVTDIVDPRGLNLPLVFQDLDAEDTDRRAQRNRIHLDVFVPDDQLEARVAAAVAAGGKVVRDAGPIWWTVADPEGNEVDLTTSPGREEHWRTTHPA